ncbi:hypothetical protein EVC45_44805, partial [Paraburkholderia sp. UYCP14C]|uniref:hypothetical protein n=1 Tax=Paraburkholderia sp. UYCP14C TaxID=2511130 RepID=UPI00101E88AD
MQKHRIEVAGPSRRPAARDPVEALDERPRAQARIGPREPQRRSRNLASVLTNRQHRFARQLQEQRDEQQRELSGRAWDWDFPQRGIRMARENYLAQRDGYGQALVFLHP